MKLSDYVWQRIAAEGVRDVFYLPGGGCMHLVDSLGRNPQLRPVSCLHEQGAAIATDAYAQVRGFGACLVTTGPGGTNALTGVAAAWCDSTPMIVISGQVKTADSATGRGVRQMGFQELPIIDMVKPITKYAAYVRHPDQIQSVLDHAIKIAKAGRPGPVWVEIPLDIQAAEVNLDEIEGWESKPTKVNVRAEAETILEALSHAQKPVILLGNGCRSSRDTWIAFAEEFGIPILTTWKAIDFLPEDHYLFAGRPGSVGQLGANLTQQNADWLLCVGARLDHGQIAYEPTTFAPHARKFVVDIDQAELNKLEGMTSLITLCCDSAQLARTLREWATYHSHPDFSPWLKQALDWKDENPIIKPEYRQEKGHVNTYTLVEELGKHLQEGDLLVPGSSGQCSEIIHQAWQVKKGLRILNSQGLGAMGFGVPAALGACIASGGKRTIVIEGDGGFAMNTQELEVIHRMNLPIKIFVLDNNGYGSIRNSQRSWFQHEVGCDPDSGLTLPDCTDIADAYGIETDWIEDHNLVLQTKSVLNRNQPMIVSVRTNTNQQTLPRVQSFKDANGKMRTKPMEDMLLT